MAVGVLSGVARGAELPDVIDLSAFGSRGVQLTSEIYGQGKLSPAGDVNGDGLADFLTTGWGGLSSGYHGAVAFLVLGTATMDPVTALGDPGGNIVAFTSTDNEAPRA